MDLTDERSHLALAYLVGLNRAGYQPTPDELKAYASKPQRGSIGPLWTRTFLSAMQSMTLFAGSEDESIVDYFVRLGWAASSGGRVTSTPLGEAVLRALDQTQPEETVIETVLNPDDPLAYSWLIARIAECGEAMIIDPYFRLDSVLSLAMNTSVTRVLTSDRISDGDQAGLADGVPRLSLSRPLEVRMAPAREMHDRFIIPAKGAVLTLGVSLHGVGRKLTVITEVRDSADEVRRRYEDLWSAAEILSICTPSEDPSDVDP